MADSGEWTAAPGTAPPLSDQWRRWIAWAVGVAAVAMLLYLGLTIWTGFDRLQQTELEGIGFGLGKQTEQLLPGDDSTLAADDCIEPLQSLLLSIVSS